MNTFDKTKRLLGKKDFSSVFQQAEKISIANLVILYSPNQLDCARLGLAISKKSAPHAHDRNRIKRLIRESFRTKKLPNVDIVVLSRPGVTKQSNALFFSKINQAWHKLSVLCER